MSAADLGNEVKNAQRGDPAARRQWQAFADNMLNGQRDPMKADPAMLEQFLSSYHSGQPMFEDPPETGKGGFKGDGGKGGFKGDLGSAPGPAHPAVETTRILRKQSPAFKNLWKMYCDQHGGGFHDPDRHDHFYHLAFYDAMAQRVIGNDGGSAPPSAHYEPAAAPPAKRQRMEGGGQPVGGMPQDHEKQQLVEQVKSFQRQGLQHKEIWHSHADAFLNGMRDPNRHDAATLRDFLNLNQNGHHQPVPVRVAAGKGGGAAPPPPPKPVRAAPARPADPGASPLVDQIKAFQRTGPESKALWHEHCDRMMGGVRDPSRHSPADLENFIETYDVHGALAAASADLGRVNGHDMSAEPEKAAFVERIKNFQRGGGKLSWHEFCGEGMRDPARLPLQTLQDFCDQYGVP